MKRCLIWLFLCTLLAGCSSRRAAVPTARVSRIDHAVTVTDDRARLLVSEARRWIGTPYRYGGTTRSGADCSGMMMTIFSDVCDLKLPRSSAQQREFALPVNLSDIAVGDLVFFATGSNRSTVSHVGLYVGSGKIIHASTSRGVIESGLDEAYYRKKFHSVGRVIAAPGTSAGRSERSELRQRIKQLEAEKKRLEKLERLDEQIDSQIDSIYVVNPAIFD